MSDHDPHRPAGKPVVPGRPLFFDVSPGKLVVMSVCTLGAYQWFWFYMNWCVVRRRERSEIAPAARTMLMVFFLYPLLRRVRDESAKAGLRRLPAVALTALYVLLSMGPAVSRIGMLPSILSVLALLPVQRRVRDLHAGCVPPPPPNSRLGALNWVAVVFGVLFWLMAGLALSVGGRHA